MKLTPPPPGRPKTLSMDKYTNEVTKVALGMPVKGLDCIGYKIPYLVFGTHLNYIKLLKE